MQAQYHHLCFMNYSTKVIAKYIVPDAKNKINMLTLTKFSKLLRKINVT